MGLSPDFYLGHEQAQELSPVQQWQQSPFEELKGGVVLQNMKIKPATDEEGLSYGGRNLEKVYFSMRDRLLLFNVLVIGAMARNKSGKGGLLMGFRRLLSQDLYLKNQLELRGIDEVEIIATPFAHCAEAVKLPKDKYPECGLVAPELNPATYSSADERNISRFQWDLIQRTFPKDVTNSKELSAVLKQQRRAVVWMVEASTPFVLPVDYSSPVEVEGEHDLGVSTLCNLAFDQRTRPYTYIFGIDPDKRLKDDTDSTVFRAQPFSDQPDADKLFGGKTEVIVEYEGKEVNARELPPEEQMRIKRLLKISMATNEAVVLQHERKNKLNEKLYVEGKISAPTDVAFYEGINRKLRLPPKQFVIPENEWFGTKDDYDVVYLQRSRVVKEYPEILEEAA